MKAAKTLALFWQKQCHYYKILQQKICIRLGYKTKLIKISLFKLRLLTFARQTNAIKSTSFSLSVDTLSLCLNI